MILVCESCNKGYPEWAQSCVYCGAGAWIAHRADPVTRRCDTECTIDYWLCKFDGPDGGADFQLFPGHPLDIDGLRRMISLSKLVTFNGIKYDIPMISAALAGCDNAQLKMINDDIILHDLKPWDFERKYGIVLIPCDHIDLFEVAPGQGSLKAYGGKMHAPKLQDLPFDPNACTSLFERPTTREYCGNDLQTTELLQQAMSAQIKLREDMSAEYGVDLRSKSDAQIAEAVMKKLLPFKVERPSIPVGTAFFYRPPAWLHFVTPYMQEIAHSICSMPFFVNPSGGVSPSYNTTLIDWGDDQVRLDAAGQWVKRPKGWQHQLVTMGRTKYAVGIGGLHSTEESTCWRSDETCVLHSPDVAAYYPSLLVVLGIYPKQIGPEFQTIYCDWKTRRDTAKAAGDKKTANSLKTLNNGTFGKLGSKYSIFYAPSEMIQVTVTGQLALLMLIERLELCGIPVISANTDGIVAQCPRVMEWAYLQCVAWWEHTTGFVMETTDFALLASRDVNSYVGVTSDGKVKLKGAYAPPEPGASGWPNPTAQVCVDAVVAHLRDGIPLAATIVSCTDVRQFVSVRTVKGGGMWNGGYLGKVVRWYYSTAPERSPIVYKSNGNRVATTDGCRPCMELPTSLPRDIDYNWYIAKAQGLLTDIGVK